MCSLMSDLMIYKFRKSMVIYDTEYPLPRPGVIKQHTTIHMPMWCVLRVCKN